MTGIERADFIRVDVAKNNPFALTFYDGKRNRSLTIKEPEGFGAGTTLAAQDLMRTLLLAHLVIRHFPKKIETNFNLEHKVFLDKVYEHYGFKAPVILKDKDRVKPEFIDGDIHTPKLYYANAHSGGLDSVYRVAKLLSEGKRVLTIHLRNLNPKGNYREAVASRMQAEVFGVPYEEVKLRNGTDNTGFDTMRTRDMFLGLVAAITGEPYGIKKVFIEGNMEEDPNSHFSEYAPAWKFFNKLIREVGLSSHVEGVGGYEIETIHEVLKLESRLGIDILPLVQNCFSAENQVHNNRRKWERETLFIAKNSPENWCGSCPKCRRMTLGRIYYKDPRFAGIPDREVAFFINDTYEWLKRFTHNSDLLTESFWQHLEKLKHQV